ncbi:MAG: hypothetical protein V8S27_03295 [Lachnospiraceae bacterium]
MEFGPYALMLGAAGALGGVFFRKKRRWNRKLRRREKSLQTRSRLRVQRSSA